MCRTLRVFLLVPIGCAVLSCTDDFTPASQVDTLRVLAVHSEPASGTPGQSSSLDLLVADGYRAASTTEDPEPNVGGRPLQMVWLGGCHNPPTRQFFGCFPALQWAAARLSPRVLDTAPARLPPGVFALGTHYDLGVPEDILTGAPMSATDPIHFGVSYAFFAACAGELRARADVRDRVPIDCVDPETGETLGRRDFVSGYATLYTYEGVTNHNPALPSVHVGSARISPTACHDDADCSALVGEPGFSAECGREGQCALVFPACSAPANCPRFLITPDVDAASAEPLPGQSTREIVWAGFYATRGRFDTATQLVNDRSVGFIADHGSYFSPPAVAGSRATIWITVNDERGGSAFQSLDVRTQ